MKQLKFYHCIECTCHRTGLTGDFIIDQDYFKHTGEKASLDSLVFKNLTDLFRYANEKNINTGRINSKVLPTYFESESEIKDLIKQGVIVCWKNEGYKVSHAQNGLHITFKRSGYYSKLQEDEYKDCFIGV